VGDLTEGKVGLAEVATGFQLMLKVSDCFAQIFTLLQ
jgi:hypothetical protein